MAKGYKLEITEADRERRKRAGRELQKKYNQMSGKGLKVWKDRDPELQIARRAGFDSWKKQHPNGMSEIGAKGVETIKRAKAASAELRSMGIDYMVYGKGRETVEKAEKFIELVKAKTKK